MSKEPEITTSILVDGHLIAQIPPAGEATQEDARQQVISTAYARLEEHLYNRVGEAAAIHGFVSWILAAHKTISDQVPHSEVASLISQYCDVQGWQLHNPDNWLEGIRPMPGLPAPADEREAPYGSE